MSVFNKHQKGTCTARNGMDTNLALVALFLSTEFLSCCQWQTERKQHRHSRQAACTVPALAQY